MGRTLRHWSARTGYGKRRGYLHEQSYSAGSEQERQANEWQALSRPQNSDVLLKGWRYDGLGHLQQRRDRLLGEQHYAHDATGRILSSRNIEAGTAQHARNDPLWHSRGEAPQQKPGKEEYFRWDDADNALPSAPGFADTASTGRVERNRVRVWQDIRYEYDGLGRVTRKQSGKRQTLKLKWNSENQLIASTTEQPRVSTQHVRYHYDAVGRRIGKTTRFGTTWFNWSGMRLIQEERGARVTTTVYEDQDSYAPLARIEHGKDQKEISEKQIFYFHTDINGAPEELTSH
ncbi:MAG: hypothetical protein LBQ20_05745, partial [Rhodanobacter sp.]|nr:hypothetical protein [Rhodanobacter sp.]